MGKLFPTISLTKTRNMIAQYFYLGLLLMIVLFFQFKSGNKVRTNLILIPESICISWSPFDS